LDSVQLAPKRVDEPAVDIASVESMVTFRLRYTVVEVTDLNRSVRFYTEVLGMKIRSRQKVTQTNGALLESEARDHRPEIDHCEGHTYPTGDHLDHIAFEVENLDEAITERKAKGIQPLSYVRKSENAKWTYVADPDGISIEIYQTERWNGRPPTFS
jgi:catechol 2,3-dioxygenase-like lactoylglutathione lyase family enzyme